MKYLVKESSLLFSFLIIGSLFFVPQKTTFALYGDGCDQYGLMAYDAGGYCKCMPGYIFHTNFLGNKECKLADLVCSEKYGTFSRYDSLSNSCECSYGYVFANQYGRTQCVSRDTLCKDQLGYSARYNTLSDSCECGYGEVISGGKCENGDSLCRSKHGLYSSYDSLGNGCRCDSGYTFNKDDQCVKKQNNVYFLLLDVDTDNKSAIIKSEYDSRRYLIEYGVGCYSSSIQRYRRKQIVVNLGTDFDVDRFDRIVLQDDDETCDIRSVERTYYDSFEEIKSEEEEENSAGVYYYAPPVDIKQNPVPSQKTPSVQLPVVVQNKDFEVPVFDISPINKTAKVNSSASFRRCPSTQCSLIRYYAEGSLLEIIGEYKKGEWYQIKGTTDAGGGGEQVTGWLYKPLLDIEEKNTTTTVGGEDKKTTDQRATQPESSLFSRILGKLFWWLK